MTAIALTEVHVLREMLYVARIARLERGILLAAAYIESATLDVVYADELRSLIDAVAVPLALELSADELRAKLEEMTRSATP